MNVHRHILRMSRCHNDITFILLSISIFSFVFQCFPHCRTCLCFVTYYKRALHLCMSIRTSKNSLSGRMNHCSLTKICFHAVSLVDRVLYFHCRVCRVVCLLLRVSYFYPVLYFYPWLLQSTSSSLKQHVDSCCTAAIITVHTNWDSFHVLDEQIPQCPNVKPLRGLFQCYLRVCPSRQQSQNWTQRLLDI